LEGITRFLFFSGHNSIFFQLKSSFERKISILVKMILEEKIETKSKAQEVVNDIDIALKSNKFIYT